MKCSLSDLGHRFLGEQHFGPEHIERVAPAKIVDAPNERVDALGVRVCVRHQPVVEDRFMEVLTGADKRLKIGFHLVVVGEA